MTISRSGIIPIGRTELPFAISRQTLHTSHFMIPSYRHVAILMTLTPDSPSIKIPAIFCPPMMASILGHSQFITRSSTSVSCIAGAVITAVPSKVWQILSRNLGTNRNNCSNVIVTCIQAKSGSGSVPLLDGPAASVKICLPFAICWVSWVRISAVC
jgi:hypothetical protein